jgi:hypothetical protein
VDVEPVAQQVAALRQILRRRRPLRGCARGMDAVRADQRAMPGVARPSGSPGG